MKCAKKTILISAGGTGGHIFPAFQIAECLKQLDSSVYIEFVHGDSDLEKSIYSKCVFSHHVISIGRLRSNVSWTERIQTCVLLPWALFYATVMILKIKPQIIFGTGGAVSGPVLLAGVLLRKKTIIWEPNVVPGLTNRLLARLVDWAIVVFEQTKMHLKTKNTIRLGFPVRSNIIKVFLKNSVSCGSASCGLTAPLRVLILGGSQGSSIINRVVSQAIIKSSAQPISFVHQTGEKEFYKFKKLYKGLKQVRVFSFLKSIDEFYEWADLVVSRSGMGVIAELSASGRAGVLIPLFQSADHHQWRNAQFLQSQGGGILIEQKNWNVQKFSLILAELSNRPQKLDNYVKGIRSMNIHSDGKPIASRILSLF